MNPFIWEKYCPDDIKLELLTFIERVKNYVFTLHLNELNFSLSDGIPGLISFMDLYSLVFNDKKTLLFAEKLFNSFIINKHKSNDFLFFSSKVGGLCLLANSRLLTDDSIYRSEDNTIINFLKKNKTFNPEWINGLAGLGNYALNRKKPNIILNEMIYNKIIEVIKIDSDVALGDLGIAHGLPGIIIYLCDLFKLNAKSEIAYYIEALVNKVQSTCRVGAISCHSYSCNLSINSRLGWCYGDISVAISLIRAGYILKRDDILNNANSLINHSVNRTVLNSGVVDGCLCHGSLGLSHLFQYCYLVTSNTNSQLAAVKWLRYFIHHQYILENCGFSSLGFLEGIIGAAHAALSSITNEFPYWHHVFVGHYSGE